MKGMRESILQILSERQIYLQLVFRARPILGTSGLPTFLHLFCIAARWEWLTYFLMLMIWYSWMGFGVQAQIHRLLERGIFVLFFPGQAPCSQSAFSFPGMSTFSYGHWKEDFFPQKIPERYLLYDFLPHPRHHNASLTSCVFVSIWSFSLL